MLKVLMVYANNHPNCPTILNYFITQHINNIRYGAILFRSITAHLRHFLFPCSILLTKRYSDLKWICLGNVHVGKIQGQNH